jgi:hypothetical protein
MRATRCGSNKDYEREIIIPLPLLCATTRRKVFTAVRDLSTPPAEIK